MKPVILIIGGHDSGKSTIFTSLTGCKSHNIRGLVKDRSTGKRIYVVTSSPQEDELTGRKFQTILRTVIRKTEVIGLVIAIQPTRPYKHLSLETIIQKVMENDALSIFAFLINPPYNNTGIINIDETRARLGELGIVTRYLDGRRFAFLNAMEIKLIAGIP